MRAFRYVSQVRYFHSLLLKLHPYPHVHVQCSTWRPARSATVNSLDLGPKATIVRDYQTQCLLSTTIIRVASRLAVTVALPTPVSRSWAQWQDRLLSAAMQYYSTEHSNPSTGAVNQHRRGSLCTVRPALEALSRSNDSQQTTIRDFIGSV